MRKKLSAVIMVAAAAAVLVPAVSFAALNPNLSQVINAGTLSASIVNGAGANVTSPEILFPTQDFSFDCVTSEADLFTASQKLRIVNEIKDGIAVDINATTPATAKWTGETNGSNQYDFNDPTGSTAGCTNGQMTVATTGSTFTKTQGASTPAMTLSGGAFPNTNAPVTLAATTDNYAFEGDLTGYKLSQKIPAEQADDTYNLEMTLTVSAN